jgi:hypothetical protein
MSCINNNDVIKRLENFGISVNDSDLTAIELITNGTEQYILNYCNISKIPTELYYTAVDMCCGTFLKTKVSTGEVDGFSNGSVSSITEGDVSIGFREGTSGTEVFMDVLDKLTNKKGELECFRKLRW